MATRQSIDQGPADTLTQKTRDAVRDWPVHRALSPLPSDASEPRSAISAGRRHPARSLVTDTASYEIRRDQQPQDAQSQACPQRPKQPIIARKEQLREEKPLRDPSFTPATENSSYTLSARKPAKHAAYDTASSSNPFPYSQLFSDEESDGMESDDASRPPYYLMTPVRRQESFLETRVEGHQVATGKMGTVCEECLTSYSQGAEPRQRTADAGNKAVVVAVACEICGQPLPVENDQRHMINHYPTQPFLPARVSIPSPPPLFTPSRSRLPPKGKKRKRPDTDLPALSPVSKRPALECEGRSSTALDPELDEGPLDIVDDIGKYIKITTERPVSVAGNFCDLFIGSHATLGRVALKRPRIKGGPYHEGRIRRFQREANTWRSLVHEHVLRFIGTCHIDGDLYMVSPFVGNGTLRDYAVGHPSLDRPRLLYETAEAIAYLHRSGVIHGDIKSENILVSDDCHALLCDFGLTRLSSGCTSTVLKGAGTTRFQSPELLEQGSGKSFQSDAWALGMTIAEVLSGRIPYEDYELDGAVLVALLHRDERPATTPMFSPTKVPYYPAWRAAIHCWARDPACRPTMEEVARMLKPTLPTLQPPEVEREDPAGVTLLTSHHEDNSDTGSGDDNVYCYCPEDADEKMVDCSLGTGCRLQWFHLACLGGRVPFEPWYCLECESKRLKDV